MSMRQAPPSIDLFGFAEKFSERERQVFALQGLTHALRNGRLFLRVLEVCVKPFPKWEDDRASDPLFRRFEAYYAPWVLAVLYRESPFMQASSLREAGLRTVKSPHLLTSTSLSRRLSRAEGRSASGERTVIYPQDKGRIDRLFESSEHFLLIEPAPCENRKDKPVQATRHLANVMEQFGMAVCALNNGSSLKDIGLLDPWSAGDAS